MRLFVACHLPDDIKASLGRVRRITGQERQLRWVAPENLHITLKFLGETPSAKIMSVMRALKGASEKVEPFTLQVRGTGGFPSLASARVLWAGISQGADQIQELSSRVESALVPLGFERESRGFSPHVTLARARQEPVRGLDRALKGIVQEVFGEYQVLEFCLVESHLSPSGPQYKTLERFGFGGQAPEGFR